MFFEMFLGHVEIDLSCTGRNIERNKKSCFRRIRIESFKKSIDKSTWSKNNTKNNSLNLKEALRLSKINMSKGLKAYTTYTKVML